MTSLRERSMLSGRLADAEVFLISIKVLRVVLRFNFYLPSFGSLAIHLERTGSLRFLVLFFEALNLRCGCANILSLLHSTHIALLMIFRHRFSPPSHVWHLRLPLRAHSLVRPFLPLIFNLVLICLDPREAAILNAPAAFG